MQRAEVPAGMNSPFVSISQDGKYMLASSNDQPVRIWDISNKEKVLEIARLQPIGDGGGAEFSPNGKYLYTITSDAIELWQWRIKELICQASERLLEPDLKNDKWATFLTTEELQRFLGPTSRPKPVCSSRSKTAP
jgi:WD40 repeat protein